MLVHKAFYEIYFTEQATPGKSSSRKTGGDGQMVKTVTIHFLAVENYVADVHEFSNAN